MPSYSCRLGEDIIFTHSQDTTGDNDLGIMGKVASAKSSTAMLLFFFFPFPSSSLEVNHRAWPTPARGAIKLLFQEETLRLPHLLGFFCKRDLSLLSCTSVVLLLYFFISVSFCIIHVFPCTPSYLLFRILSTRFCISFLEVTLKMTIYILATIHFLKLDTFL